MRGFKRLWLFILTIWLLPNCSVLAMEGKFQLKTAPSGFSYPNSWHREISYAGTPYYRVSCHTNDREVVYTVADLDYLSRTEKLSQDQIVDRFASFFADGKMVPVDEMETEREVINQRLFNVYTYIAEYSNFQFYYTVENNMLYSFRMKGENRLKDYRLKENLQVVESFYLEPVDRKSILNRMKKSWNIPLTETGSALLPPMFLTAFFMLFFYFFAVRLLFSVKKALLTKRRGFVYYRSVCSSICPRH